MFFFYNSLNLSLLALPPLASLLSGTDSLNHFLLIISKADRVFSIDRFEVFSLWLILAVSKWNK